MKTIKILLIPALLTVSATTLPATERMLDPNFIQGTSSWPTNGSGGSYDTTQPGETAGSHSIRVTNRSSFLDGPEQNIISRLPATPPANGEPVSTRIRLRVDAGAFVRCYVKFKNTVALTESAPQLVAEAQVTANTWTTVEGSFALKWTAGDNRAWVYLEIGNYYRTLPSEIPNPFPSFTVASFSMDTDSDLDSLRDTEESNPPPGTPATHPNLADSDLDGLPDAWEIRYGLNPNTFDPDLDSDADGFTNREEYLAATLPAGPGAAASVPGIPSDPQATPATAALLRWFALLPSRPGRHCAVGQMLTDPPIEFLPQFSGLADASLADPEVAARRWPAIMSMPVEAGNAPMGLPGYMDYGLAHLRRGGILIVKWAMWNPWTGNFTGDASQVDIPGLLDPASATYNLPANAAARVVLDSWIDTAAAQLARAADPAQGGVSNGVVLFRPLSEMNGPWFWWGHRPFGEYQLLWRHLHRRLTGSGPGEHGLHHLLWIYESAQTEHYIKLVGGSATGSDYYYPGDDVVDIWGHNLYDDDWVLPVDLDTIYRRHPKPYCIPQAGPDKAHRDGMSFSNLTYIDRIHAAYPRLSFFCVWNTFTTWDSTLVPPASVINHIAIIDNPSAVALMNHPEIVTLETSLWRDPDADTDSDGGKNLIEYALGSDPANATPTSVPWLSTTPSGDQLELTFPRISDPDLTYAVEATADLADWGNSPVWTSTGGQNIAGPVAVTDPAVLTNQLRRFLRLRVTEN